MRIDDYAEKPIQLVTVGRKPEIAVRSPALWVPDRGAADCRTASSFCSKLPPAPGAGSPAAPAVPPASAQALTARS